MRGDYRIAYFAAWAVLSASVLAEPAQRAGSEEGVAALDAFAKIARLDPGEEVLGLVGFFGQPLPVQWLILTGNASHPSVLRESVFARERILAERKFSPLPGQDLPHLPIPRGRVKVDSREAFALVESLAKKRRQAFDSAHFQLRVRDEGHEPVWMLSLVNEAQVSVGVVYLSAASGEVLREKWRLPAPPASRGEGNGITQLSTR